MHLRFDDVEVYWDFKRRFADAFYYANRHAREWSEYLERVALFDNFDRHARLYLGDAYHEQLGDSDTEDSYDGNSEVSYVSHEEAAAAENHINEDRGSVGEGDDIEEVGDSGGGYGSDGASAVEGGGVDGIDDNGLGVDDL